jgi:RHS repeat-associated protein
MGYLGDGQNELITDGSASLHNSILDTTGRTVSGTTDYFTRDDEGHLLADRGPSSTKYYLLDPLDSVLATTNSSGAVSASYSYDPYGNSIGSSPSPFGYVSGYRTTGGLYHFGSRYYNPADQRWTTPDPIREDEDNARSDAYAYVGGDPINQVDANGCEGVLVIAFLGLTFKHTVTHIGPYYCVVYHAYRNYGLFWVTEVGVRRLAKWSVPGAVTFDCFYYRIPKRP